MAVWGGLKGGVEMWLYGWKCGCMGWVEGRVIMWLYGVH